jgi:pectate lyase-like protein
VAASGGTAAAADRPVWNRRWNGQGNGLWREYLSRPDTHPLVPNVSYAGYHRGERPIPRPRVRASVTSFGAVGDGTIDCTAVFNEAVERVGAAGGGAVYVPPGTFLLTGVVWVHRSNVVIRGAGRHRTRLYFGRSLTESYRPPSRQEWSWNGGMVWFMPRELRGQLEAAGFVGNEGWLDNQDLAEITGPVPRGARHLPVSDAGRFRPGQHVLLLADNTPDNTLLAHLAGDVPGTATYAWETAARRLRPELTDWPLKVNFARYRFPVEVARVGNGFVTLAQPLRIDLRPGWSPRFATLGPAVRESGIEDLTIEMRLTPQTTHHQDLGFNGPHFQATLNCWARDVDLWHSDNGFGSTTSKNLTLTGVRIGGRARHHTFICRVQTNDMLVDHFEIPPATVPVAAGAIHHGLNTEGLSGGNVWCDGVMEGTFDSHRALPFESVRTAITVTNNGSTGGAGDAGPRWGARFCHWNIDVLGGRAHGIRLEEHAPRSAMVGIRGTTGPTDHPKDFTGDVGSVADALDEAVYPTNLYQAQLRHRLRGTR